jgi:hypothetical protein
MQTTTATGDRRPMVIEIPPAGDAGSITGTIYRTSKRSSEVQGRYRHKGGAPASTTTATPSGVSGEQGRYSAPEV